ncbi:MAG: diguanylate cyclase [Pedosphaera sp.]|nr:diguanylate cyclase [Pedosphaera sp.]
MVSFATPAAATLLMLVVLPLWMAAGLADYFCHRATSIEMTSGTRESVLHLIQFALVGIPITLAMFVQTNAGYFALAILFIVLHHAAAAVDLVFANPRRHVAPREQMVHSLLEILPITALFLLAVLYWPQFLALFGFGAEQPVFAFHVRVLPIGFVVATLAAAFLLNLVPYIEELSRCMTRARQTEN